MRLICERGAHIAQVELVEPHAAEDSHMRTWLTSRTVVESRSSAQQRSDENLGARLEAAALLFARRSLEHDLALQTQSLDKQVPTSRDQIFDRVDQRNKLRPTGTSASSRRPL